MSKRSSKLIELSTIFSEIDIEFSDLSNEGITDMITIIKKQEDTRYKPNVKHKMEDIILITLFAMLAKCNEWTEIEMFAKKKEEWLRKYLDLPNGIPSHDTIQRVVSILNPQTLYADTINYLISKIDRITSNKERDILSMDGKTTNGSSRSEESSEKVSPVNTMSVYSTNYGISLIQDFIDKKTNEIPIGPELLKKLNLKDCIVVADALNTQKKTIECIIDGKADYVMLIKENQQLTLEEIREYFNDTEIINEVKDKNYLKKTEKEHNAVVTREYYMSDDLNWMSTKKKWKGIKSIALAILKFVQTYYKISLNLIRTNLAFDFENEIENVFKLLDAETLKQLKNT